MYYSVHIHFLEIVRLSEATQGSLRLLNLCAIFTAVSNVFKDLQAMGTELLLHKLWRAALPLKAWHGQMQGASVLPEYDQ